MYNAKYCQIFFNYVCYCAAFQDIQTKTIQSSTRNDNVDGAVCIPTYTKKFCRFFPESKVDLKLESEGSSDVIKNYLMSYPKIKVPPRFELGSLDSKSRVLTITPWDRFLNKLVPI